MQPLLNASKAWFSISAGSLKKKRKASTERKENKTSVVTEANKPKANCICIV